MKIAISYCPPCFPHDGCIMIFIFARFIFIIIIECGLKLLNFFGQNRLWLLYIYIYIYYYFPSLRLTYVHVILYDQ